VLLGCNLRFEVVRKEKLSLDISVVFSLLAMVLASLYIIYSYWPVVPSRPNINVLEEYVKAVMYLNKSALAIESELAGYPIQALDFTPEEAVTNRNKLEMFVDNLSHAYGSGDTFIVQVARSYLYVAEASANSSLALVSLNNTGKELKEALALLARCRIDEALERYSEIELRILNATYQIENANNALSKVNKATVAENHVSIIDSSQERLWKSLNSLRNAILLMETARKYGSLLKTLCSGNSPGTNNQLSNLLNDASKVKATGPLAPDIMNARNAMIGLVARNPAGQERQISSGQSSSGGQGGGAGYVPPSSDD
jgi:dimeric dUTPase (all-alpha-NTP-PPase superfamily)